MCKELNKYTAHRYKEPPYSEQLQSTQSVVPCGDEPITLSAVRRNVNLVSVLDMLLSLLLTCKITWLNKKYFYFQLSNDKWVNHENWIFEYIEHIGCVLNIIYEINREKMVIHCALVSMF